MPDAVCELGAASQFAAISSLTAFRSANCGAPDKNDTIDPGVVERMIPWKSVLPKVGYHYGSG